MALDRRIVELYDEYTHKPLDRRVFMNRLLAIAGTAAAAEAALALLEPNYAHAQQVAPDDARITASRFGQTVDGVALKGYLVTPKAEAKRGGVLVIHENRGLNPHIEDITRRMALEGFTALGLDFLTPLGGTPTAPTPPARSSRSFPPKRSSPRAAPRSNTWPRARMRPDEPVQSASAGAAARSTTSPSRCPSYRPASSSTVARPISPRCHRSRPVS